MRTEIVGVSWSTYILSLFRPILVRDGRIQYRHARGKRWNGDFQKCPPCTGPVTIASIRDQDIGEGELVCLSCQIGRRITPERKFIAAANRLLRSRSAFFCQWEN